MSALEVALLYFGPFLVIGLVAKLVIARWMALRGADLSDVHAQAGSNRGPRWVFLLGLWRKED
jgi:hypothetical protein